VDAEVGEPAGDGELVLDGEGDVLALRAVTQRVSYRKIWAMRLGVAVSLRPPIITHSAAARHRDAARANKPPPEGTCAMLSHAAGVAAHSWRRHKSRNPMHICGKKGRVAWQVLGGLLSAPIPRQI